MGGGECFADNQFFSNRHTTFRTVDLEANNTSGSSSFKGYDGLDVPKINTDT